MCIRNIGIDDSNARLGALMNGKLFLSHFFAKNFAISKKVVPLQRKSEITDPHAGGGPRKWSLPFPFFYRVLSQIILESCTMMILSNGMN